MYITTKGPAMATAKRFTDLIVWQKAHVLVQDVYSIATLFPRDEVYCLTAQLKRAIISVPANIAEGFTRTSNHEKIRFYNIAQASLEESRYFLILAHDLHFTDTSQILIQLTEVARILESYKNAVPRPKR